MEQNVIHIVWLKMTVRLDTTLAKMMVQFVVFLDLKTSAIVAEMVCYIKFETRVTWLDNECAQLDIIHNIIVTTTVYASACVYTTLS